MCSRRSGSSSTMETVMIFFMVMGEAGRTNAPYLASYNQCKNSTKFPTNHLEVGQAIKIYGKLHRPSDRQVLCRELVFGLSNLALAFGVRGCPRFRAHHARPKTQGS